MKKLLLCLVLVSCKPPTPAQEVTVFKTELDIAKVKCAQYLLNPKYPRDSQLDTDCGRLTAP